MGLESIIENFDSLLDAKTLPFIIELLSYSKLLAAVLMLIFVGYKVLVYMSDPSKSIDPFILIRPVVVLAAMSLYTELVEILLFTPVELITDIVTEVANKVGGADIDKSFRTNMTHVQSEGGDGNGVYNLLELHPILELIHIIIYFIASVVGGYILFTQLIMKYFYFIIGVFVLPFSLIIGNQRVLTRWFFSFLSILLWEPILYIVKLIISILPVAGTNFTNVLYSIVLQIIMIFFVLRVPSFANLLVSEGQGNSVDSSTGMLGFMRGLLGAKSAISKLGGGGSGKNNSQKEGVDHYRR